MNGLEPSHDLALAMARLLSSETRLRLLFLLQQQGYGRALCVNALAYRLGISQAAASQHLRRFKDLGLVVGRESGACTHYFLNSDALACCRAALDRVLAPPSGPRPDSPEETADVA